MAEYWPSSFCVFDLTLTPTHKNAKNKTKQNKTTKSTHKKSKLKIHNRGHTFKRKKHGELHIQL